MSTTKTNCIHSAIAPDMERCANCGLVWSWELRQWVQFSYRYGLEPSRSYFLGYELWTFGSQLSKEEIDHFDNVLGYNKHTIQFALYRADRELDEYFDKNPPIPMTTEDPFGTKD